jgi:hypothetical protein
MATNAGTGLGIALGGRAKDFTQVEMAARRQKQLDEQKARQAKDKELEDITKDIFVKPGQYLPMREAEVQREMAQYIKDMQEATGYGERMQKKFDFLSKVEKYKAEKQAFDKEYGSITSGKKISDDDVSVLITASNPDEVLQSAKRGGIVQGSDGTFRITAYEAIDIPSRQSGLAARVRNEFQGRTVVGADGKMMNVLEPTPDDFRAQLASDFDQNLNVRANAARQYRDELDAMGLEGAERIAKAKELYIERGLPFLTGSTVRGSGGGININVNTGNQNQPFVARPVEESEINVVYTDPATGREEQGTYRLISSQSLGDAKATLPKDTRSFYIDTGESVTEADIENVTFNKFGIGYVLTKPFTVTTPNGKKTFKKGTVIEKQYEDLARRYNAAKPEKLVFARTQRDRSIVTPAEEYYQTRIIGANEKDARILEGQFQRLEEDYQKELRKQKSVSSQPRQNQSAAPKATSQPKSNKRIESNPALQELMKQRQ